MIDPSSLRPSTKTSYRYISSSHIVPVLGDIQVGKLKPTDIQLLLRKKQEEGLSDRTRQLVHATLRRALQFAVRTDVVTRNVATLVQAPRPQRDTSIVHPLTLEQAQALRQAAVGTRLNALWLILLLMGLRKGEALALRWTDVDLANSTVNVQRTLSRVKGHALEFGPTKSDYSRRSSFIPLVVLTALQSHLVE